MSDKPVLDKLDEELSPKKAVTSTKPEDVKAPVNELETTNEIVIEQKEEEPMEERERETLTDLITPAEPTEVPRPSRGRGRPRILSEDKRKATQIFLTESERELATRIGKGQMSVGIRLALESYEI